jgi:phage tail sheath protein FI
MTTYSRPGVFIQEVQLPEVVTPGDVGTAIGAFVGALEKGPTSSPVLLNSWTQFTKIFGALNDTYPTTWAAYNFFANGGRQLYVKRISGTGAAASSVALSDRSEAAESTLLVAASNTGLWGNYLAVEVKAAGTPTRFNLVVYLDGGIIEQFTDLSMDTTDPRYVESVINSQSAYIVVDNQSSPSAAPDNMPAIDGLVALSGGVNGSAPTRIDYSNALITFDPVQNPLVFNIPAAAYLYSPSGNTNDRTLAKNIMGDLVNYCELRGDAFAVVDVPRGQTPVEAQLFIADVLAAAPDSDGGIAAAYYPWLVTPDSLRASGTATRLQAPGAAMVGQYLATDASRGVFKAPAGLTNRIALAVATESQLTNAQLDGLNDSETPINVIRQVTGAGIVSMGGRTLHNSTNDRYINKQRSLIYIKKELENRSAFAVFENNDILLWKKLQTTLSSFLTSYWQQGGLRGNSTQQAYYVKVDSSTTSFADIQNGRVNIEIGVALQYPAEFIVIKLGQLTGNASV